MLDLRKGWDAYDAAYREEEDPRRRAILAVMKDHLKWEVLGQPDRILESVSQDAVYRFYGLGQTVEYRGLEEIRAFYQGLADSGANVLQLDIEHLAVADWGLAAHGIWHQVYPGSALSGPDGLVQDSSVDDADANYLVSQRMSWFFPFSDHEQPMLLGEIVYFEQQPCAIRKLESHEVVISEVSEDVFA
jgi:hypothetical protein